MNSKSPTHLGNQGLVLQAILDLVNNAEKNNQGYKYFIWNK